MTKSARCHRERNPTKDIVHGTESKALMPDTHPDLERTETAPHAKEGACPVSEESRHCLSTARKLSVQTARGLLSVFNTLPPVLGSDTLFWPSRTLHVHAALSYMCVEDLYT